MRINRHALEAFRVRSGLSVTALARAAGRDQSTLSNILAGRSDPSEAAAQALADALGVDVAAIRIEPPTAADALKVLTAHVRAEQVAS
jgi:transcriptional regulator with XRE-family HTH domain